MDTKLLESWPYRCPVQDIVNNIKDIVKNKRFCDVGCGGGDLVSGVSAYAESACGIEIDYSRFLKAKQRGLEVYNEDFYKKIPKANVYFFWVGLREDEEMLDHLFKSADYPFTALINRRKENEHTLNSIKYPMEKRYFPYQESHSALSNWPTSGDWVIGIIKNHER